MNPSLFKICKNDAINICNAKSDWHEWGTNVDEGPLVLPCLYHHIDDAENKVNSIKSLFSSQKLFLIFSCPLKTRFKMK